MIPIVNKKYVEMQSNLNSAMRRRWQREMNIVIVIILHPILFVYLMKQLILPLLIDHTEEWKTGKNADTTMLANGPVSYLENEQGVALNKFFTFIKEYVKYIYKVGEIKKWLYRNKGKSMLDFITPSDVAYCVSFIENSRDLWEQDMLVKAGSSEEQTKYKGIVLETEAEREKHAKKIPKFTKGEKTTRTSGAVMWNQEGERFYTRVKGAQEGVFLDKI